MSSPSLFTYFLKSWFNCELSNFQETEAAERFTVQLSDPKGGAEIGSLATATVVILENDYPLYFVGEFQSI